MRPMSVAALLTLLAAPAMADTRIVLSSKDTEVTFSVQGQRVRVEDNESPGQFTLFDTGASEMTVVDGNRKTYFRVTEETGQRIRAEIDAAIAQMEEQLGALPEEQREALRKLEPGALGFRPELPTATVVDGERSATVSGVTCQVFTIHLDNEPAGTLCVADHEALAIPKSDYDAIRAALQFMLDLAQDVAHHETPMWSHASKKGIAVRVVELDSGDEAMLRSIGREALDPGLFQVPEGYTEQQVGGPRG